MATLPIAEPDVQAASGENQQLPEELQNVLKKLVEKFQQEDKYARRAEVVEARRQRFYDRGDQYIYWNANSFIFVPVTGGSSLSVGGESVDMPRYTDVYDIYGPYNRNLVALMSQNPPGINFEPIDPSKPSDISAASAAEKFKHVIDQANDSRALQSDIARLFNTDGRVVLWAHTVTDKRFGVDEMGQPKSGEVIDAHGVLESKVPINTNSISEWPGCVLSKEIDISIAKQENPDFKDKIKEGASTVGESAYERFARLGVLQGTRLLMQAGDAYAHLVTQHHAWLRPCYLDHAPEKLESGSNAKEMLQQTFPDGVHVKLVGGAFCGAWNESIDDHLSVGFPKRGDGMARPSWLKALVPIQDAVNDYMNMRKEYHDYGIPVRWVDEEAVDIQAVREQVSEPGNMMTAARVPGTPLADAFYTEEPVQMPADMVEAIQELRDNWPQFQSGAQPALFGGQISKDDRVGVYAMARDQAMGVMSLPWGALQEVLASANEQAIMLAAQRASEEDQVVVSMPGPRGTTRTETIALGDLKKGNFRCYPDKDSSFPESRASKQQALATIWQGALENPVLLEAIQEPDNLELMREVGGIENFRIPAAEARNKQLREIEQLLNEAPIPPDPQAIMATQGAQAQGTDVAAQHGQPPPQMEMPQPKSSVDVDPVFDFHKYEFQEVQTWLSSEEKVEEERKGNLAGIENVRLHGIQHFQIMQAQMAMQAAQQPAPQPQQAKPQKPGSEQPKPKPPAPQAQPQGQVM